MKKLIIQKRTVILSDSEACLAVRQESLLNTNTHNTQSEILRRPDSNRNFPHDDNEQ